MLLNSDFWPPFMSVMGDRGVGEEATVLFQVPSVVGEALQSSLLLAHSHSQLLSRQQTLASMHFRRSPVSLLFYRFPTLNFKKKSAV